MNGRVTGGVAYILRVSASIRAQDRGEEAVVEECLCQVERPAFRSIGG